MVVRKVTCDHCKEDFEIGEIGQRSDTLEGKKLTIVFFTCPNCSKEYIASVMDSKVSQLKEDHNRARETFNSCDLFRESQKKRKAWKEMEYCKKKIVNYQDKLKKEYMKELRRRGYY